jgi:monofunctional biosynthetic peptidoglycan transglycosylase
MGRRQRRREPDEDGEPRARRGRAWRWIGRILTGVFAALALFAAYQFATWPDVAGLRETAPQSWAFLERARSQGRETTHRWVPYAAISPQLKIAVLVAEDINFFSHSGFDTEELRRAVREAWAGARELRGASTLTQQLVKNLWLSPSRNPWRKVKEAILTWQIERALDKRRILELYLNVVEFGPGFFGAEAAAQRYFGRSAKALSSHQAALLAASLPHSAWSPERTSRGYLEHVERIEGRMERAGGWLAGEI